MLSYYKWVYIVLAQIQNTRGDLYYKKNYKRFLLSKKMNKYLSWRARNSEQRIAKLFFNAVHTQYFLKQIKNFYIHPQPRVFNRVQGLLGRMVGTKSYYVRSSLARVYCGFRYRQYFIKSVKLYSGFDWIFYLNELNNMSYDRAVLAGFVLWNISLK